MSPKRRTDQTIEMYERKVRLIRHEAVLEDPRLLSWVEENNFFPAYEGTTGRQLIDAYHRLAKKLTLGSQVMYRSALLWFLHANSGSKFHAPDFHDAYLELRDLKIKRPSPKSERPKDRPIYISQKDLDLLENELRVNRGQAKRGISIKTLDFLKAGIAAGLRPNEWEHARWADAEQTTLLAPNSKQRPTLPANLQIKLANQKYPDLQAKSVHDLEGLPILPPAPQNPFRSIPIDPSARVILNRQMDSVREHLEKGLPFSSYYDCCRKRLERACKEVFKGKKRYSLYVARHQFAATIKTIYPETMVAQIMGHTAVSTARVAYAASRYAGTGRGAQRPGERQTQVSIQEVTEEQEPAAAEISAFRCSP